MFRWKLFTRIIFLICIGLIGFSLTHKSGPPAKPYWCVEAYVAPKQGPEPYAPPDPTMKEGLY